MPNQDPRIVQANRFKNEPTDRGLTARLQLAVHFPFEDFLIKEIEQGTSADKLAGAIIERFGELIGVASLNIMHGDVGPSMITMTARLSHEIHMKALTTILKQDGIKRRPVDEPANDDEEPIK